METSPSMGSADGWSGEPHNLARSELLTPLILRMSNY